MNNCIFFNTVFAAVKVYSIDFQLGKIQYQLLKYIITNILKGNTNFILPKQWDTVTYKLVKFYLINLVKFLRMLILVEKWLVSWYPLN